MDNFIYVLASFALFIVGLIGVITKRNALVFFLSIEMLLNASNLLFVTFANRYQNEWGLIWVFFVLVVAAAEAAVGFGIILNLFRSKESVDVDQYDELKG
jgi:NADH-quinone oxidoreductase subunit K